MQPVLRLIKQPFLKLALQLAMVQFIEEHIRQRGSVNVIHAFQVLHANLHAGVIGFNDGNVFLSVTDDYVVWGNHRN